MSQDEGGKTNSSEAPELKLENDDLLEDSFRRLPALPSSLLRASRVQALVPRGLGPHFPPRIPRPPPEAPSPGLLLPRPRFIGERGVHSGAGSTGSDPCLALLLAGRQGQQGPALPPRPCPYLQPGRAALVGVGSRHRRPAPPCPAPSVGRRQGRRT
jgi:hypothetical protein